MDNSSRIRIALFSLLGILILVFSIWGIIAIARNIFKPKKAPSAVVQQAVLSDYAKAGTSVKLQVGGPIVGDEKYVSYQIQITESSRTITTFAGYQQTVTNSKQYDNNAQAYQTFLRALERENFLARLRGSTSDDYTAVCTAGKRYVYVLTDQQGATVSQLWNSACSKKNPGTAGGNTAAVRSLFKAQIADFSTVLSNQYSVLR